MTVAGASSALIKRGLGKIIKKKPAPNKTVEGWKIHSVDVSSGVRAKVYWFDTIARFKLGLSIEEINCISNGIKTIFYYFPDTLKDQIMSDFQKMEPIGIIRADWFIKKIGEEEKKLHISKLNETVSKKKKKI